MVPYFMRMQVNAPSPRPDALKSWIVRHTSIPPARQILMTARGKNVKIQTLATEV